MVCKLRLSGYAGAVAMALLSATSINSHAATLATSKAVTGSWSDTASWTGSLAPANTVNTFSIVAGANITATDVAYIGTGVAADTNLVTGTLTIGSGANFTSIGKISSGSATGTINIKDGGKLTADSINPGSGSNTVTVNISNSGQLTINDLSYKNVTVNINSGGKMYSADNGSSTTYVNLNGGSYINTRAGASAIPTTWTGGTLVLNSGTNQYTSTYSGNLATAFSGNSNNVLVLSNQTTKQTLTIFSTTFNAAGANGTVRFNVYSATADDCDLMTYAGTIGNYSLGNSVHFQILSGVDLSGVAGDYLGKTYKLVNDSTSYTDINAVVDASVWSIGGAEYNVAFTNNLSTNGTVTVASIDLVNAPEPASAGLFGLGAFFLLARKK